MSISSGALDCMFAGIALALYGANVDRAFWSTGPGGVGQSLTSHLIAAAFGNRHAWVDMRIYFMDDDMRKQCDGLMHALARLMCHIGDPRRPAWKWSEKPGQPPDSRGDLLTHDPQRYADELWWRAQRPELVMGPGSWRWIERAYASMRRLARRAVLARVQVPVLILATDQDALVSFKAIGRASRRLPQCDLVNFGDRARHEILREADPVRCEALDRIDLFLARAIG